MSRQASHHAPHAVAGMHRKRALWNGLPHSMVGLQQREALGCALTACVPAMKAAAADSKSHWP